MSEYQDLNGRGDFERRVSALEEEAFTQKGQIDHIDKRTMGMAVVLSRVEKAVDRIEIMVHRSRQDSSHALEEAAEARDAAETTGKYLVPIVSAQARANIDVSHKWRLTTIKVAQPALLMLVTAIATWIVTHLLK